MLPIANQPLTDEQWATFDEQGFVKLGHVYDQSAHAELCDRIDQIMLGRAQTNYDRTMMQLDSSSGAYQELGEQTTGHKGATLNYRKIQGLEFDPLFLRYMQLPVYRDICAKVHGPDVPIACFRAMFMNKPAQRGTFLPWHQDRWRHLDRDPLVTVWLAMDPSTRANGCVQVIPGSHRLGVINPSHPSGFLNEEQAAEHCGEENRAFIELEAGEVVLLHNWLLHSSDRNATDHPRRAFSVCYMDARTNGGQHEFPVIFGEGALDPSQVEPAGAS